tara:strand:+ start:111152 stop:112243 length:1092 start_codon:yes stop_codon:yes gene_type:complete
MPTISISALLILLAGTTLQTSAIAQDSTAPEPSESHPKHQQIEIIDPSADNLPRMGTDETPIKPTEPGTSKPHQTGLTSGQDWMQVVNNSISEVQKPSALAQGSFILSRSGRLVPAPNDRLIFVPDLNQRIPGEGPVLLLPCAALERLESIWANQTVTVSGEILTYHARNHLLISDFSLGTTTPHRMPTPEPETDPETEPDTELGSDQPPSQLDEDPDVMDLLRELEDESSTPSGVQITDRRDLPINPSRPSFQSTQLETAPPELAPGLREGTLLIRRPARMDRGSDGSWMAVFDNDQQYSANGIQLTILPCALLMTMEQQAIHFGDTTKFVVSGRVYIHNNRGYLLPTFYQRSRTSDIKPWQ